METKNIYSENEAYKNAKNKVKDLKEFYSSLASYCIVIPILIFINLNYGSRFQWFWFPLLGWGFGLATRGLKAYGAFDDWEERKIKEIMSKQK